MVLGGLATVALFAVTYTLSDGRMGMLLVAIDDTAIVM